MALKNNLCCVKEIHFSTSLAVQWLRTHLPKQATWVGCMLQKDSTCCEANKPTHNNSQTIAPSIIPISTNGTASPPVGQKPWNHSGLLSYMLYSQASAHVCPSCTALPESDRTSAIMGNLIPPPHHYLDHVICLLNALPASALAPHCMLHLAARVIFSKMSQIVSHQA